MIGSTAQAVWLIVERHNVLCMHEFCVLLLRILSPEGKKKTTYTQIMRKYLSLFQSSSHVPSLSFFFLFLLWEQKKTSFMAEENPLLSLSGHWLFSLLTLSVSVLFWSILLWCSQCGDGPQEDLARFGYKLNTSETFLETYFTIFGYILEPCIEICRFFLNFDQILVIENLLKYSF